MEYESLDVGSGGGVYDWKPRASICLSYDLPASKHDEQIVRGDAHHLPFRDKQFTTVFAFNLLEHVKNPYRAVGELRRVGETVKIRQDGVLNLANYATPEHLWFQLPRLRFLPYPRTRLGIGLSRLLRVLLTQAIPRAPYHHQVSRMISFFMPPHQQYEMSLNGGFH